MRKLSTKPHLTNSNLNDYMESQKNVRAFRDWQIIYSVQTNPGHAAEQYASMLGVNKHKVFNVIQLYNKHGMHWRSYENWGGRREQRCILSLEQEASLLRSIENEAMAGQILTYNLVKELVEKKVEREVSNDYVWDMFNRHNWKKKVPRQSHPKADKIKQQEYKKNSKKYWQPNQ